jgi:hypothetical protein
MDENALPLVDQKFIYPKDWAISVTFLSFLQDRRNRLPLESIVVLSLKSHVGSFYRCSGLSNPLATKKPQKKSPAENRISSEFWTSPTSIRKDARTASFGRRLTHQ